MHIAYVVKRYPRYSETFVVNEILAHEAAGLAIEIFSLRQPADTHFQDTIALVRAPVTYLPQPNGRSAELWSTLRQAARSLPGLEAHLPLAWDDDPADVHQALALALEVRARGIQHLHAHFASGAATVARLAARFAGCPYSFTAHAKDIFHEDVRPADLQHKQRDATAIVTVSDYNVEVLRANYPPAAPRVHRIYNGLDLGRFRYEAPRRRPPLVVAVGRLVEKKGFADLVDACALLAARGRSFRCDIIGEGELEASLRAQIDRLGLANVVTLVGPRPQREVIGHVRRAAAMAAPCVIGADGNRDGLPTTLLEAMALGTTCVSTDVTGIPEVVRHDETGLLVAQHDPPALAAALERLLDDVDTRVRLATAARRLIEAEFDVRTNAARLRRVFAAAGPVELRMAASGD